MLLHLLRRLLLAIPALWLLGTLVFLLSRMLPGSFGEERFLNPEAGFYNKSSQRNRAAAFQEYQQKTGQDLPLFYFSISSSAIPDNLKSILPEARSNQLQLLTLKYRNWPAIAAFDEKVQQLAYEIDRNPSPRALSQLQVLRFSAEMDKLELAGKELQYTATAPPIAKNAASLLEKLEALKYSRQGYAFLLPNFTWNGTDNQYHRWLSGILTGDFGNSYRTGRPVLEMISETLANTFWLLLTSMFLTLVLAIELSILMAKKQMRWLRRILLSTLFIIDSIPMLVLAMLLLVLLANPDFLQLFPVYGMGYHMHEHLTLWQKLGQQLQYMALPLLALVLVNLPYITNQVYSSLRASLQADFTRTARAKGLSENKVIRKHALRNALLPLITIVSEFLPALVSGSILIETIYALPGIGRLLIESVLSRDYPVLVAIILVVVTVRMAAYALADTAYSWADPRIKQNLA